MAAANDLSRVIEPRLTLTGVTAQISDIALRDRTPLWWWVTLVVALGLLGLLVVALARLFFAGIGIWGVNIPVAWGLAIANYVWWIGLAAGGTIISSLFFLTRSEWRNATNRLAETMTLFCAAAAGIMPIIHLGRWWYSYWLFPYPNVMGTWPQFRSPLHWDFVALFCYVIGSIVFWYMGMLPDVATLRDRAQSRAGQVFYGILALGWQGSTRQWRSFRTAYLLMAALMAPLIISVHSIVGLDFAGGLTPGWHSTQLPPYFVFGAVLSSFGLFLVLLVPLRTLYRLEDVITERHLDVLAKLTLTCSLLIAYAYALEAFMPFYSGKPEDVTVALNQIFGTHAGIYWSKIVLNVAVPQLLWIPALRRNRTVLVLIGAGIVVGMWIERYLIVVGSLDRAFLPSVWQEFVPTFWDWATLAGSVGILLLGLLLFLRLLPIATIFELRQLIEERRKAADE
jgi:molybdopterin-containing oxidoreductase family membrane subunit